MERANPWPRLEPNCLKFSHPLARLLDRTEVCDFFVVVPKRRKIAVIAVGVLYVIFGILAFFNIPGPARIIIRLLIVPGIIDFHAQDYGVHFATGCFFLVLALFPARTSIGADV